MFTNVLIISLSLSLPIFYYVSTFYTECAVGTNSPQNCSVQRMYYELNGLMQDLETLTRIGNLIRSLRFQYAGLSPQITEQIAADIRAELRRKDAQIALMDRSCFQLRIRAKNY